MSLLLTIVALVLSYAGSLLLAAGAGEQEPAARPRRGLGFGLVGLAFLAGLVSERLDLGVLVAFAVLIAGAFAAALTRSFRKSAPGSP